MARKAELQAVMNRVDIKDLKELTLNSYHNLVSFLFKKDGEWYKLLGEVKLPLDPHCHCDTSSIEDPYDKIKEDLKRPCFQTGGLCFRALKDRSCRTCASATCGAVGPQVEAFVERVVKLREDLYDKLVCGKQYII